MTTSVSALSDAARSRLRYRGPRVRRAAAATRARIRADHPDPPRLEHCRGLSVTNRGRVATFSEHRIGMNHVAFAAEGDEELPVWRRRFEDLGMVLSDINETPTGSLVTLRGPDNIQLAIRARSVAVTCSSTPSPLARTLLFRFPGTVHGA